MPFGLLRPSAPTVAPVTDATSPANGSRLRSRAVALTLGGVLAATAALTSLGGPPAASAVTCSRTITTSTSIASAMSAAKPGQTICLRGGTYNQSPNIRPPSGTSTARITLRSYPGERAVIAGIPIFNGLNYWTFTDLTFKQGSSKRLHMVKIHGGTGWILDRVEMYGSSQTLLLVAKSGTYGAPKNWAIRNSFFHDAGYTTAYINPGPGSNGLVERNLFWNAGTEAAKIGWGGTSVKSYLNEYGTGTTTFRYNTLYGATQGFIVAEPGGNAGQRVDVYRNLIVKNKARALRVDDVEHNLGGEVYIRDNAWFDAPQGLYDFGHAPDVMKKAYGNVKIDPKFKSIGMGGFVPTNAAALAYGRYAP